MAIRKVPRVRQAHENPVKISEEDKRLRNRRWAFAFLQMSSGALATLFGYWADMKYTGYFSLKPRLLVTLLLIFFSSGYLIASRKKKPKEKEFAGIALNADGTVGRMP